MITMIVSGILGGACCLVKQSDQRMSSRDGYFIVASAWILISLIGALPLYLGGGFPSYWNALFEIVSGFTTTGASVLARPEDLGRGVLFWRSFTHWIGGMGVLVFLMMVMPMENDNSMHLVRAEVPGPTAGKLVPRMRTTSRILYSIYGIMTLILVVLLCILGMKPFDSFCIAFGTAGTGGFATSGAGIGGYGSLAIEVTLGIFMLLFGVNFSVYHLIMLRKFKEAFSMEEVKAYFVIVALSTAAIAVNILRGAGSVGNALRGAFFQVSSIITTTGFATVDFELWPEFSKHLLVLLMIIGACAGSTGGGMKVSRILILAKTIGKEIRQILHPKSVNVVKLDGKRVSDESTHGVYVYVICYLVILAGSILLVTVDNFDFTTNFTAVLTTLNNVGPGLSKVGPVENFSQFSYFSKVILSMDMLVGRLEILPMLMLFAPQVWRKKF